MRSRALILGLITVLAWLPVSASAASPPQAREALTAVAVREAVTRLVEPAGSVAADALGSAPMFEDAASSSFAEDITWLVLEGITNGCSATAFCPTAPVTRAQMASLLARGLQLPSASVDYFDDDDGTTHEADINRIAAAGITTGCGLRSYCPTGIVIRAQMASFIVRSLGLVSGSTVDAFTDDETSSHEADINRLANAGVTTGCSATAFCPTTAVTRGQMAAFLHRGLTTAPSCDRHEGTVRGTSGADSLVGTAGNDVIVGFGGDDEIDGGGGIDRICGGDGNDFIQPGGGNDWVDGGGGTFDTVVYVLSPGPVSVSLATGQATGQGSDNLRRFEVVAGSNFADSLVGSVRNDTFFPGGGNDTAAGGAGTDIVAFVVGPVTATMSSASGEGTDAYTAIEGLAGSTTGDILTGDGAANLLFGLAGDDQLLGGGGTDEVLGGLDDDTIDGGPGNDVLYPGSGFDDVDGGADVDIAAYLDAAGPVSVDLTGLVATGDGTDTLAGVEGALGSEGSDTLAGDGGANLLVGYGGNDVMSGAGGNDVLDGGLGTDNLDGGAGSDTCYNGETVVCETADATASEGPARLPTGSPLSSGPTPRATPQDQLIARVFYNTWATNNPGCFDNWEAFILPPDDVHPVSGGRELIWWLPELWGWDGVKWNLVRRGQFHYKYEDPPSDWTLTPFFLADFWVEWPNNTPPGESNVPVTNNWLYQWWTYVWWPNGDRAYYAPQMSVFNGVQWNLQTYC